MKRLIFLLITLLSAPAFSEEFACIQYQKQDNTWGDAYKVPYQMVDGEKMIELTGDRGKYSPYNMYAVVEWPNGGYSALKFPSYKDDLSSFSYEKTKGQNGRTYRIMQFPSFGNCPNNKF